MRAGIELACLFSCSTEEGGEEEGREEEGGPEAEGGSGAGRLVARAADAVLVGLSTQQQGLLAHWDFMVPPSLVCRCCGRLAAQEVPAAAAPAEVAEEEEEKPAPKPKVSHEQLLTSRNLCTESATCAAVQC